MEQCCWREGPNDGSWGRLKNHHWAHRAMSSQTLTFTGHDCRERGRCVRSVMTSIREHISVKYRAI